LYPVAVERGSTGGWLIGVEYVGSGLIRVAIERARRDRNSCAEGTGRPIVRYGPATVGCRPNTAYLDWSGALAWYSFVYRCAPAYERGVQVMSSHCRLRAL